MFVNSLTSWRGGDRHDNPVGVLRRVSNYTSGMKSRYSLALMGCLLMLASCGREACDNLPVCLNPPPSESQPAGGIEGARVVEISPGQSRELTLTLRRVGLPEDEPVSITPVGPPMGRDTVLARSADGFLIITGDPEPFTGNITTVNLRVAASAPVAEGIQTLKMAVRKQTSKYPRSGEIVVSVLVR